VHRIGKVNPGDLPLRQWRHPGKNGQFLTLTIAAIQVARECRQISIGCDHACRETCDCPQEHLLIAIGSRSEKCVIAHIDVLTYFRNV
jgi:hypothetical protein